MTVEQLRTPVLPDAAPACRQVTATFARNPPPAEQLQGGKKDVLPEESLGALSRLDRLARPFGGVDRPRLRQQIRQPRLAAASMSRLPARAFPSSRRNSPSVRIAEALMGESLIAC